MCSGAWRPGDGWLRNGLARDEEPAPVGSATQGSYAMRTMIHNERGDRDIDDGVYFTKESLVGRNGADKTALAARRHRGRSANVS